MCGRGMVWRGTWVVVCVVYWRCQKGAVVTLISCNAPMKASGLLGITSVLCSLVGQDRAKAKVGPDISQDPDTSQRQVVLIG